MTLEQGQEIINLLNQLITLITDNQTELITNINNLAQGIGFLMKCGCIYMLYIAIRYAHMVINKILLKL